MCKTRKRKTKKYRGNRVKKIKKKNKGKLLTNGKRVREELWLYFKKLSNFRLYTNFNSK